MNDLYCMAWFGMNHIRPLYMLYAHHGGSKKQKLDFELAPCSTDFRNIKIISVVTWEVLALEHNF